jgi:Dolichyl-phosphate-mannose-protein mannosyltransferase
VSATDTLESGLDRAALRPASGLRVPGRDRERVLDWLAVGLPTLLALALCVFDLTTRSLWLDESATVAIASQHGGAFGAAVAHDGGNMLAYYGLLHVLIAWFGSAAFVIRFPSVLFAAATVGLTAALGLRLFGRRIAALAGTLTAVSLTLVYWGQDARGYAAMVMLIVASYLAFLALLEPGAGWRPWVAYVVLSTAAVYAGLEAVLVIPAQLAVLVWRRERWRAVASAAASTAACCIPLAVLAADRGSGQLFWVPPPSGRVLRQVLESLTSAGLQPEFYTPTSRSLLVLTLAILAIGGLAVVRLALKRRPVHAAGLVVAWLTVPAVVAALESAAGQSIFQPRYLLVSLPAVSLLLGWTLLQVSWPRAVMVALGAALITLRVLQLAPAYGVSSENWRGLTRYVVSHSQARDCIAFYPLDNRQAFRYYLGSAQSAPRPLLPATPWRQVRPFVEDYASLAPGAVARLPASCGRVWLVSSHEGRAGGPPASQANYQRFAALTSGLRGLYPRVWSADFGAQGLVTLTLYSR